jgi:hypothetical protein
MKIAVCVPPSPCDCYGHLTRYAEKIAALGAERHVDVEVLRYTEEDFLARLFVNLMDDECAIHFHSYLYDLQVHTSPASKEIRHALEFARARCLATVSDHPFSDFMQDMVRNAHPKTRFIVVDNTFPDEMRFINPALEQAQFIHQPFVAPLSYDDERFVDFDLRDFDLVLPLFLVDLSAVTLKDMFPGLGEGWFPRAIMATYETVRTDLSQNPFHAFSNHMRAELGAGLQELRDSYPTAVPSVLSALSRLDGYVRQERRNKVVGSLLRSVGALKVGVLGEPIAGVETDPNVHFLGNQRAPETAALMANSRAVLNCSPSYPTNIHERVTVGMLYGSCVITDTNPCIEENFTEDDYVSYAPGSSLTIEDIFATRDMRGLANQSRLKAKEDPRFSWQGHFDAVVDIARA